MPITSDDFKPKPESEKPAEGEILIKDSGDVVIGVPEIKIEIEVPKPG
jgi:hypothetical protein